MKLILSMSGIDRIDSTGIHALLRRRVKKIFAMIVMNKSFFLSPLVSKLSLLHSNSTASIP
jgi:hypothetical protein